MDPTVFTTSYIVIVELVLSAVVLQIFRLSGASPRLLLSLSTVLLVWIAAVVAGIPRGWFLPEQITGTGMYLIMLIGAVGMSAGILAIAPVRRHLLKMPPEFLLFPQTLRVFLGAGFLIETALGILPMPFGILDGLTHITAGFLAMSAALGLALWQRAHFRGVWLANIFGMLDIIAVATGIAFVMLEELTTRHNILIVVFFVAPLLITFHLASMWQAYTLRHASSANRSRLALPLADGGLLTRS